MNEMFAGRVVVVATTVGFVVTLHGESDTDCVAVGADVDSWPGLVVEAVLSTVMVSDLLEVIPYQSRYRSEAASAPYPYHLSG